MAVLLGLFLSFYKKIGLQYHAHVSVCVTRK